MVRHKPRTFQLNLEVYFPFKEASYRSCFLGAVTTGQTFAASESKLQDL